MLNKRALGFLLAACGLGAIGCGGDPSYNIGGYNVVQRDSLYLSKPTGYFCNGMARGQLKVSLVDYTPACPLDRKAGDPDPYDQTKDHSRIDLVLAIGGNPMYFKDPFTFDNSVTCDGGGADSLATFVHVPAGDPTMVQPDKTLQADSGSILLQAYDPADMNPLKAKFDLTFQGKKISGSFTSYACNQ